jgi:hypothetical protein
VAITALLRLILNSPGDASHLSAATIVNVTDKPLLVPNPVRVTLYAHEAQGSTEMGKFALLIKQGEMDVRSATSRTSAGR